MDDNLKPGEPYTLNDIPPIFGAGYETVTIVTGQNIAVEAGMLVPLYQDADGKYAKFEALTGDTGACRPCAFIGHSVDASNADVAGVHVYTKGKVIIERITFTDNHSLASVLTGAPKGTTVKRELEQNGFTFITLDKVEA